MRLTGAGYPGNPCHTKATEEAKWNDPPDNLRGFGLQLRRPDGDRVAGEGFQINEFRNTEPDFHAESDGSRLLFGIKRQGDIRRWRDYGELQPNPNWYDLRSGLQDSRQGRNRAEPERDRWLRDVMYEWRGDGLANMHLMFQNGKLVQKTQFGLK